MLPDGGHSIHVDTYTHKHISDQAKICADELGGKNAHTYIFPMDTMELLREIKAKRDIGQAEIADRLGVTQATVSRWFAGSDPRGSSQEAIKAWHQQVFPGAHAGARWPDAPIISWVSAGALKTPEAVEEIENAERVLAPGLDPKGNYLALRVEGDSMDRISPPESIIVVNTKDRRLVQNACYVIVDQEDGAASYKRWRPGPDRWEPVSVNPDHEPIFITAENAPKVIGRVKRTILDM